MSQKNQRRPLPDPPVSCKGTPWSYPTVPIKAPALSRQATWLSQTLPRPSTACQPVVEVCIVTSFQRFKLLLLHVPLRPWVTLISFIWHPFRFFKGVCERVRTESNLEIEHRFLFDVDKSTHVDTRLCPVNTLPVSTPCGPCEDLAAGLLPPRGYVVTPCQGENPVQGTVNRPAQGEDLGKVLGTNPAQLIYLVQGQSYTPCAG